MENNKMQQYRQETALLTAENEALKKDKNMTGGGL